jgi:hypothetical protein
MPDNINENQLVRARVIDGLRELADFLDTNPDLPVNEFGCDLTAFTSSNQGDADSRAQVNQVASMLGVPARDDTAAGGHYAAVRSFGPVQYKMIYIPARCRAAHAAFMSYSGCVAPDTDLKAA